MASPAERAEELFLIYNMATWMKIEEVITTSSALPTLIAMSSAEVNAADKCPVDHASRQKWLDAAKHSRDSTTSTPSPRPAATSSRPPSDPLAQLTRFLHPRGLTRFSLDQGKWEPDFRRLTLLSKSRDGRQMLQMYRKEMHLIEQDNTKHPVTARQAAQPEVPLAISQLSSQTTKRLSQPLPTHRQISSIPRATPTNHDRQALNSAERAALPHQTASQELQTPRLANSEQDTGHDRSTGNWIYPSQSMFFEAMKRKGHAPEAEDMETIVPIHNAVNERAWKEIREWEAAATIQNSKRGDGACDGPKLVSFSGDSTKLTPRARWRTLVGYQNPFDRHDWVVERCDGQRVEYVIDFYQGKDQSEAPANKGAFGGAGLNFYLDIRPKLNSWEGWKMRSLRAVGLSRVGVDSQQAPAS